MSVMNIKRGTQGFSKAEQTSSLKNDSSTRTVSAAMDLSKETGEQNVGDVLNKIADPNWVDPAKKQRPVGNGQLDKDAFLKLMLTQMKYQDPTNPMQSHEMAAQLAQFTSLEQLNNINSTLTSMKDAQSPSSNYQALALIGKKVSGDASKINRVAGDTKHAVGFELLGDAAKVRVTIKDSTGKVVRKIEVGPMKKGRNSIEWNGIGDDGMAARPGEYRLAVEGMSNTGGKVFAKTAFGGRITGLNYTPEGPVLLVGNQSIKLSEVKKIEEPGADDVEPMRMQGRPGAAPAAAPSGEQPIPETQLGTLSAQPAAAAPQAMPIAKTDDNVPPAEEPTEAPGNIDNVPMSSELLAQIAKAR